MTVDQLQDFARRLSSLAAEPEPGLSSWCAAVVDLVRGMSAAVDADLIAAASAFVKQFDDLVADAEGRIGQDPGCIECTVGTVPDRFNTGLCGYHATRAALAKAAP